MFPDWFVGVAFAAIAIGALVPAAVMSIAAANLFTRKSEHYPGARSRNEKGRPPRAPFSKLLGGPR